MSKIQGPAGATPLPSSSGSEISGDAGHIQLSGQGGLGELKAQLIAKLGEQEGTKMYNQFIQTIAIMFTNQNQQANQRVIRAMKKERQDNG